MEKMVLGGELKDAVRPRKAGYKAWLENIADLHLVHREDAKHRSPHHEKSKIRSWENFAHKLNSNCWHANKVFLQTIQQLRGKKV